MSFHPDQYLLLSSKLNYILQELKKKKNSFNILNQLISGVQVLADVNVKTMELLKEAQEERRFY